MEVTIDAPSITSFVAERLEIGVSETVSKELREYPTVAENMRFDIWENRATKYLVLSLRSFLLDGHKFDRTQTVRIDTPATPWEFFKQEYMPKWFVKRFPVRVVTQHVVTQHDHHYMCPHLSVPSDKPHHLYWMMNGPASLKDLATYYPYE
jgi:hypothetical protein